MRLSGQAEDTRAVFAFVVDSDADKGEPARLPTEPTMIVETSPGNFHFWYFLEKAITDLAEVGEAIRAATGGITTPALSRSRIEFLGRRTIRMLRSKSADASMLSRLES